MIISHHRKFIFLKTSKSAGSSLEIALSEYCGEQDILTRLYPEEEEQRRQRGGRNFQNDRWPLSKSGWTQWRRFVRGRWFVDTHTRAQDAWRLVDQATWDSYFKFAFVRNPWDRAISQWFWRCKTEPRPTLPDFLRSKQMRSMNKRGMAVYSINGKSIVDRLCRYENMPEELAFLSERLALGKPLEMPNAKGMFRKDRRHYSEWYDNDSRDLVARMFADEIALTGYTFEDRR
jgi:hypothetical protein